MSLICLDAESQSKIWSKILGWDLKFVLELSQGSMVVFQRPLLGQIRHHRGASRDHRWIYDYWTRVRRI